MLASSCLGWRVFACVCLCLLVFVLAGVILCLFDLACVLPVVACDCLRLLVFACV